jgi:hypothetical protein
VGFMAEEVSRFKAVMGEMGADMVAVIPAGRSLMASTLQQALEGGPAPYEQVCAAPRSGGALQPAPAKAGRARLRRPGRCPGQETQGSQRPAARPPADAPGPVQPPLGQRRAVIMSGMFTSEVLEVISGYKDAGLPPTVFAAAVPNNYARAVGEVVESCWWVDRGGWGDQGGWVDRVDRCGWVWEVDHSCI